MATHLQLVNRYGGADIDPLPPDKERNQDNQMDSENTPDLRKRTSPDDGHSPEQVSSKRAQITVSDPSNQVSDDNLFSSNQQSSTSSDNLKWSFIFTSDTRIDKPDTILNTFSSKCNNDLNFTAIKQTRSKKVLLVRSSQPAKDFNSLQKHLDFYRQTAIHNRDLKIEFFDPNRSRKDPTTKHVIVKNVPDIIHEDTLKFELECSLGCFETGEIETVKRIISKENNQPTNRIRIVLKSVETARQLIRDGIKVCGLVLKCEAAYERQNILRCYKCQQVDHTHHDCVNQQKCAKCSENHRTNECQITDTNLWKCPNCNGAHASWYYKCPINVNYLKERKQKEEERKKTAPMMQPVNNITMQTYASKLKQHQDDNTQHLKTKLDMMEKQDSQINRKMDELIKQNNIQTEEKFDAQIKQMQNQIENLRQENATLKEELKYFRDNYDETHKLREEVGHLRKELYSTRKIVEHQFEWLVQDLQWIIGLLSGSLSKEVLRLVHKQRIKGFDFETNLYQSSPKVPQLTDLVAKIRWACTRPKQNQADSHDISFLKT